MKNLKKYKLLLSTGLICLSVSFIIWNFKGPDFMAGLFSGLAFVFVIVGFLGQRSKRSV